jgi:simple sugar transport system substrate-binding protein
MFRIGKRAITTAAVLACAALVAAGCSSQGGAQSSARGAGADGPRLKFAMVTHAPAGDTFFDIIRKGADAAAAQDNVDYTYAADGDPTQQAVLIQNAVDSKVDGLLVSVPAPAALTPAIQKALAAGIPVVGFNAGGDTFKQWGALMYFGQDEAVAGRAAGQRLQQEGAKNVVCVVQAQGQIQLETRCAGVNDGLVGGKVENLNVNGTDQTAVRSTIQSKLREDRSVDHVITLGAPIALTAVQSVKDAGSSAKIVTFDTNAQLVDSIKAGDVQWAVDQQPYLQGYEAVDSMALYKRNGNVLGGGQAVLTGPSFIDSKNIGVVTQYAKAGTR